MACLPDYGQMEFVPPESGGTDLIHIYCIGCAGLPPSKYMKITNSLHSQRQFEGLESRVHI